MALIKCPECGKEISDKANACIHCGYPLNEQKEDVGITDFHLRRRPHINEDVLNYKIQKIYCKDIVKLIINNFCKNSCNVTCYN